MYMNPHWSADTSTSLCRSPSEKITYESVLAFPALSNMSCLSYLVFEMGDKKMNNCFQDFSKQYIAFLRRTQSSFSLGSKWCIHTVVLT